MPRSMDSETHKTETLYSFLAWLEKNKKQALIGAVAVLVVIGVIATVVWYGEQKEFAASEALAKIHPQVAPGEPIPPDLLAKLQKVAEEFRGTTAAARADLVRGGVLYSGGRYPEAQAVFEKFLRDHPESRWSPEADFGIAASLDAQNKFKEAIARYDRFTKKFGNDPNVDLARLNLAGLYEAANQPQDALQEYDKVINSMVPSALPREAHLRKEKLVAKYPSLIKPITPPTTTVVPPGTNRVALTNLVLPGRTNLGALTNRLPPAATNLPSRTNVVVATNPLPPLRTNLSALTNRAVLPGTNLAVPPVVSTNVPRLTNLLAPPPPRINPAIPKAGPTNPPGK
jgi:predicted negative regulator of RcsB-dependent stress response